MYADWLQEQGDVRGRLIVLQHQLETTELSEEERRNRQQQIEEIEQDRPQQLKGTQYEWRFGFVVGVRMPHDKKTVTRRLVQLFSHPTTRFLTRVRYESKSPRGCRILR